MNAETKPGNRILDIVSGSKVIEISTGETGTIEHEFINTKIKNGQVTNTHGVLVHKSEGQLLIAIDSFRQRWILAEGEPQSTW